ncbi:RNA polymerase sigma factor [Pedobacter hiemivivus]|uniref:Sigma-70 family RNA polymerase sigma factor n=1 Tax=Pedobacter hiemivivus TaxID=2530454 RepID=A0A4R0NG98_9SPHI|nr:sigma-70 family RNA polymerase sigma factor [Pedobacter hiemivivus]TCC99455.1 sigma-70 family RNA polymerase sigma factor [Pedobacter hiemivivus]
MKQLEDSALLGLLRNSDYKAFDELYLRFWKTLYMHALKKTGSSDDASDLVQEVFTDLWDRRKNIPEINAPFKHYLRSMLIFKVADYFRRKGFSELHIADFEEFLSNTPAESVATPAIHEEHRQQFDKALALINKTVANMPKKMRRIFVMSRSGKYSVSQIAESLDISNQTVKNQTANAMQRLRKATADFSLNIFFLALFYWLTIS